MERVLALQRSARNHAVSSALARGPVIAREITDADDNRDLNEEERQALEGPVVEHLSALMANEPDPDFAPPAAAQHQDRVMELHKSKCTIQQLRQLIAHFQRAAEAQQRAAGAPP